jgi:transposase
MMEVTDTHCAASDVHKKTAVVCCLTPGSKDKPHKERRTFGTMTHDLLALAAWLTSQGVTHVVMDSTGEYVRRITARAIPPAGRLGSGGNPGVND